MRKLFALAALSAFALASIAAPASALQDHGKPAKEHTSCCKGGKCCPACPECCIKKTCGTGKCPKGCCDTKKCKTDASCCGKKPAAKKH
jgi:hypothetical protein